MITNPMATALRNMLIPQSEKFTATITLFPMSANPTVINANGCWWKPLDVTNDTYAGIMLEGGERLINIPAEAVHTSGMASEANREIHHLDTIDANGVTYNVLSAGLRSVSSRWECLVRKAG